MGPSLAPASSAENAVTIDRRSARGARVEVITRGERRRSWTALQKREIVVESLSGELTPTEVARKHGIGSGLLYTWRQQFLGDALETMTRFGSLLRSGQASRHSSPGVPAMGL